MTEQMGPQGSSATGAPSMEVGVGWRVGPTFWNRLSGWAPLYVVDRLYISGFPLNININE